MGFSLRRLTLFRIRSAGPHRAGLLCTELRLSPFPLPFSQADSTRRQTLAIQRLNSTKPFQPSSQHENESFFCYEGGRWLWNEEQELRDRYKAFNIPALQNIAAKAVGSKSCISITKLAEGQSNKVFSLVMNDGKKVLARIPTPKAGPAFYTTASEVATMELARGFLQIPIPRVFDWSATDDNPVESEYIIMEEAVGTRLGCYEKIVSIERKLTSVAFSHYGNIYFASDNVPGAVPAQIISEAPADLIESVSRRFTIGPVVNETFWSKERSVMDISRGPWTTPTDYALSISQREIAFIERYAVPEHRDGLMVISSEQNIPAAHIRLLNKYSQVVPPLFDLEDCFTRSTLWHEDLHGSNLFVENDHITAVIDWQGVWAGPLFLQADPSPVLDYRGEHLFERPDNYAELDAEKQADIRQQIVKTCFLQLYLFETKKVNPVLARVYQLDHGRTRRRPLIFAGNSWAWSIIPLRGTLVNVERYWNEMGMEGDCPISFTEDEMKCHREDAENWNLVQNIFDSVNHLVKRDGWTYNETFDDALDFFIDARKALLEMSTGDEKEEVDRLTQWVENRRLEQSRPIN